MLTGFFDVVGFCFVFVFFLVSKQKVRMFLSLWCSWDFFFYFEQISNFELAVLEVEELLNIALLPDDCI